MAQGNHPARQKAHPITPPEPKPRVIGLSVLCGAILVVLIVGFVFLQRYAEELERREGHRRQRSGEVQGDVELRRMSGATVHE